MGATTAVVAVVEAWLSFFTGAIAAVEGAASTAADGATEVDAPFDATEAIEADAD